MVPLSSVTLALWVLKWPKASCPFRTGHCTCPLCVHCATDSTARCSCCRPHLINLCFPVSTSLSSIHTLHVQQNINPPCGYLAGADVTNNSTNLTGQFGWNLPSGKTSLIYPRLNHNFSLLACRLISNCLHSGRPWFVVLLVRIAKGMMVDLNSPVITMMMSTKIC